MGAQWPEMGSEVVGQCVAFCSKRRRLFKYLTGRRVRGVYNVKLYIDAVSHET